MHDNYVTVDARGLQCPKPLILTRKQLAESTSPFIVLIDDKTAKNNISRFLTDNKILFKIIEENNIYRIMINADQSLNIQISKNNKIESKDNIIPDTVICIKGLEMGMGPEELGDILLRAFITTIKELSPLPSAIVLYNAGVKIAEESSSVLNELIELERLGVKILVCGTCTNYFEITEKIKVGIISNMYEIMDVLSSSDKIIYP